MNDELEYSLPSCQHHLQTHHSALTTPALSPTINLVTTKGLLLRELEWITGSCARLLALVKPDDLDFRPTDRMRSLRELGHHLAQIPAVDLAIMRGLKQEEVQAEEDRLSREAEASALPGGWQGVLGAGTKDQARSSPRL